jgi:hypothetical protein
MHVERIQRSKVLVEYKSNPPKTPSSTERDHRPYKIASHTALACDGERRHVEFTIVARRISHVYRRLMQVGRGVCKLPACDLLHAGGSKF